MKRVKYIVIISLSIMIAITLIGVVSWLKTTPRVRNNTISAFHLQIETNEDTWVIDEQELEKVDGIATRCIFTNNIDIIPGLKENISITCTNKYTILSNSYIDDDIIEYFKDKYPDNLDNTLKISQVEDTINNKKSLITLYELRTTESNEVVGIQCSLVLLSNKECYQINISTTSIDRLRQLISDISIR